ncbi:Hypothetical protein NTJ_01059 [Nesidiocoris tenuis]|uniref:Uncharacterized protein n=1 Tax=Nesidiocoris tenuis TaxID=355587 RepID=A0ABN7A8G3_9HEMI|nr:Hypothetical protein NTJ_01059 [Nesidiocoris tenuis]
MNRRTNFCLTNSEERTSANTSDDQSSLALSDPISTVESMERTSASLKFFQNIVRAECGSAVQMAWAVLLREIISDKIEVQQQIENLRRSCLLKDELLAENVNIVDELQAQFSEEKRAILKQQAHESAEHRKTVRQLESTVKRLEQDLAEAMEIKNEIVGRFNTLFRKRKSSKVKKQQLIQEVEDLAHEVEMQKDVISQLKKALSLREIEMAQVELSYNEGFKHGRQLATVEEMCVLEQYKILKDMELVLELDARCEQYQKPQADIGSLRRVGCVET